MKTLLKVLVVLVVLVVIVVAGVLWYANRYIQSPEFKQYVLGVARDALGAEVQVTDLEASIFRGVSLRGIRIANPSGYEGDLLTARALVVRYELWPLLRRRVQISTLTLENPEIRLVRNATGEWNYDQLGTPAAATTNGPAAPPTATTPGTAPAAPAVSVALPKIALTDARVLVLGEQGKELVAIQDADLASSMLFRAGQLSGNGNSSVQQIAVAKSLFVTDVVAPVVFAGDRMRLTPLRGKLADGVVGGEIALQLLGGIRYFVDLTVTDADMAALLQQAGTKPVMSGKLQVKTSLSGTGGLPTINGQGQADILNGKLIGIPLLETLATLLQVNELRDLAFTECKLEFKLDDNQLVTPVIRLVGPQVQIIGQGTMSLADYTLNHQLSLALAPELLAKLPKEIRAVFTQQEGGRLGLSFKVTGPYDAPKTDLQERLLKGAGQQLLQKGLEKLFK